MNEKIDIVNCFNCIFALDIPDIDTIKECACPTSGCFKTDVTAFESCYKWSLDYHKKVAK